jgi:hypothetical protein
MEIRLVSIRPALRGQVHQEQPVPGVPAQVVPREPPMSRSNPVIQVHIERLILEGQSFAPGLRNRIAESLQEELGALLQSFTGPDATHNRDAHSRIQSKNSLPFLPAPDLQWLGSEPGSVRCAPELGTKIAWALYAALTAPEGSPNER